MLKSSLAIAIIAVIGAVLIGAGIVLELVRESTPSVPSSGQAPFVTGEGQMAQQERERLEITVRGGEINVSKYGYAVNGGELRSPGPEIRVKAGTEVIIKFINEGVLPHTFTITSELRYDATPLWGASAGTVTKPVMPGESVTIRFVPNRTGSYYYLCAVPGHIQLGMYGTFVVTD